MVSASPRPRWPPTPKPAAFSTPPTIEADGTSSAPSQTSGSTSRKKERVPIAKPISMITTAVQAAGEDAVAGLSRGVRHAVRSYRSGSWPTAGSSSSGGVAAARSARPTPRSGPAGGRPGSRRLPVAAADRVGQRRAADSDARAPSRRGEHAGEPPRRRGQAVPRAARDERGDVGRDARSPSLTAPPGAGGGVERVRQRRRRRCRRRAARAPAPSTTRATRPAIVSAPASASSDDAERRERRRDAAAR